MNCLMVLFFIICVGLLLYPYISNHIVNVRQMKTVHSGDSRVEAMPQENIDKMKSDALAYNRRLAEKPIGYAPEDSQIAEYLTMLNPEESGLLAVLKIPQISLTLPVYHTVSDAVLQIGVGHVPGSSLPVDGCESNIMLMAHRGLPSATLFSNLDRVELGDSFTLTVLDTEYVYTTVNIIPELKPDLVSRIGIEPGRELCTLVTCTPYGINSDRLVVQGELTSVNKVAENKGETETYSFLSPFVRKGGPDMSEIMALIGLLILFSGTVIMIVRLVLLIRNGRRYVIE